MRAGVVLGAVARVTLAVVLVGAAVSKLRRPDRTRDALARLFAPATARVLARALPIGELVLAAMLLAWWGSVVPGVITAVVFVAFTAVLVRAQVRGVPCACFGAPRPEPPGTSALVRNGVLAALAVLATGA